MREVGAAGATHSWVGALRLPGPRPAGCAAGKKGQSLLIGSHHCSIAWLCPFWSSVLDRLLEVSKTLDPSAPRPYPPTQALATPGGESQPMHARTSKAPPHLQACAPLGPSARNVSPSLRSDFGCIRPSSAKPPYMTTQDVPNPTIPETLGLSVSGSGLLETLGVSSLVHRSWRRLDNPQGIFVPFLPGGLVLCPL